jgi:non-ribosomal peptide synthetase component E (peptide arylation enzyme)
MTYAELDAAADRLAHGLRCLGLRRGDRVVFQLPNVVEFPAVCFGLLRLGALPIFALPPHREHEISYLARHSEAVAYLASDTFGAFRYGDLGAAARKASPSLRHVLLLDGPDDEGDAAVDVRRLLEDPVDAAEARASADAEPPDPSDVAFFLLSGGTTGLPKLIPRTHDDYAYNVRASAEVSGLGPSTVYLVALPAAHNFPLGCPGLMGTLSAGGEAGELLTRGPYTIRGYYRADVHNAAAFTADGFYRTGDIVRLHPSGNLTVEGRAKDLINRGGEKISAEEIENLLLAHPAVKEAAAVAMPHAVLGEQTCAYLVVRPGETVDLAALSAFLEGRGVARFKWPERLELVDALPVTNVGKVDKKRLREDIVARLAAESPEMAPS